MSYRFKSTNIPGYCLHPSFFNPHDCIVWLTNMERTDYADQTFFLEYNKEMKKGTKLVVCINHIDKFTPQNIPNGFDNLEIWDEENNCPTALAIWTKETMIPLFWRAK